MNGYKIRQQRSGSRHDAVWCVIHQGELLKTRLTYKEALKYIEDKK